MILWLTGKSGFTSITKALLLKALRNRGVSPSEVIETNLYKKAPNLDEYEGKKGAKMPPSSARRAAMHYFNEIVKQLKPRLIVIQDEASLRAIVGESYALGTVRGSVYQFENIPLLVLDKMQNYGYLHHGKFTLEFDLDKLARYATGKAIQEPTFDFRLARSASDIEYHIRKALAEASLISEDVETSSGFTTVQSFTYDTVDKKLVTICIPFFDPRQEDGAYWRTEDEEVQVRELIRELHESPIYKTFSNGMYDAAYFIKDGIPPHNWFLDTQYMMWSLWCEAPKTLNFTASIMCDGYQYWKDEVKGYKEDALSEKNLGRYWRYNGLDTYWTWLSTKRLLTFLRQYPYGVRNYSDAFLLAAGPCLASSMRGMLGNKARLEQITWQLGVEADAALKDCRDFIGEADYNPNSGKDAAWVIYDVLGGKKTRIQRAGSKLGPRSVDEKVLKLIKEQRNVVLNHYIDLHLAYKKPANNISKYGNWWKLTKNGRFMSWLNPCATTTSRFNSTNNQFWVGTNAQNIPQKMREWIVADKDYVLVEFDYSTSDDWFIGYHSEDQAKIDLVNGDKDGHCFHASIFFGKPYEEIHKGWKEDAEWCVDSTKGVRQNTKRLVHGRNFGEGASTAYNVMGRDAVVATAIALGYSNASGWSDKELIGLIAKLFDKYDHPRFGLYRRLRAWQDEIIVQLIRARNIAATAFGFTRKFFGNPAADHAIKRELCSFYGQGGTAGNINRALRHIFYRGIDDGLWCYFLAQTHDSILFAIHRDNLAKIPEIISIMEQPITINGRTFHVPAAAKCGLTWAKKMLDWRPDLTYEDVEAFETKHFGSKYKTPEASSADIIAQLGEMLSDNIPSANANPNVDPDEDEDEADVDDEELLELGQAIFGPELSDAEALR